jgi:hypothetical protein
MQTAYLTFNETVSYETDPPCGYAHPKATAVTFAGANTVAARRPRDSRVPGGDSDHRRDTRGRE